MPSIIEIYLSFGVAPLVEAVPGYALILHMALATLAGTRYYPKPGISFLKIVR